MEENDSQQTRRKMWVARLIDTKGQLVRMIPMSWRTPPRDVPGFMEFDNGAMQVGSGRALRIMLKPRASYRRIRLRRSDERLTIVEYQETIQEC